MPRCVWAAYGRRGLPPLALRDVGPWLRRAPVRDAVRAAQQHGGAEGARGPDRGAAQGDRGPAPGHGDAADRGGLRGVAARDAGRFGRLRRGTRSAAATPPAGSPPPRPSPVRGILAHSGCPTATPSSRVARVPRKSSSATLLLSAAVTAVTAATASGCVSVPTPTAPAAPSPAATAPAAPRPDGHADDRPLVQAPAREAMERTGPSPHRTPAPRAQPPSAPPRQAAPPRRTAPEPPPRTAAPKPAAKPSPAPKPPAQTDVCALGRQYGGWDPDSPQSVICRDTYGS